MRKAVQPCCVALLHLAGASVAGKDHEPGAIMSGTMAATRGVGLTQAGLPPAAPRIDRQEPDDPALEAVLGARVWLVGPVTETEGAKILFGGNVLFGAFGNVLG